MRPSNGEINAVETTIFPAEDLLGLSSKRKHPEPLTIWGTSASILRSSLQHTSRNRFLWSDVDTGARVTLIVNNAAPDD